MAPSARSRSLVVGTVAALAALAAAVGAGALVESTRADGAELDAVLRLGPEDGEAVLGDDPTGGGLPGAHFELLGGGHAGFADYEGRPLVVNFLASWCEPCEDELPGIEAVHGELGDRVAFLGINTDEDEEAGRALVERTGVTFPVGRDGGGSLTEAFGVVNMPSTFLVSADGEVVHAEPGALEPDELRALVDDHLL